MAKLTAAQTLMLAEDMAGYYDDPVSYALAIFPWDDGSPDYVGPLAGHTGLRKWQEEFLMSVAESVKDRAFNGRDPVMPIQHSTVSGHGIGKSALTAILIKWIMDTRPFAKGVVTANTSDQLRTKTWAELGKWHKMSLTEDWFEWTGSKGNMALVSKEHPESWRVDAQVCREENSESFAGLHSANSTPFYIFDEASAIPEKIYEVAAGGLTDGEPMMFLFGNPTRNSGSFYETHNRHKHLWKTRQIDSRDVEGTNHEYFESLREKWGEDSDKFRVRCRGMFPRSGSVQFIGHEMAAESANREPVPLLEDPLVLGVDVARFGDDVSVLYRRRGRDGQSFPILEYNGLDTMQLAAKVAEVCRGTGINQIDAVYVDGGGVGGGVIDRLRQMGLDVFDVQFGGGSDNPVEGEKYANKRSEMWGSMREWLKVGSIVDDEELIDDLTGPDYAYNVREEIQLETKRDMKKRGVKSPDKGDALCLTFAYPAFKSGLEYDAQTDTGYADYDPLGDA